MINFPSKRVQLHTHGPQSVNDSALDYKSMIKRAKELGISAIALTDHGTMTGIFPFRTEMFNAGLQPILGVEAYYKENDQMGKAHLILMAKDDIGLKSIYKAVTQSNKRIDSKGAPCMNAEILENNFGPRSKGHDHVVATTACVQGYVNIVLSSQLKAEENINKLLEKRKKYKDPASPEYEELTTKMAEIDRLILKKSEEKKKYNSISKRSFAKKTKELNLLKESNDPTYETAKKSLEEEIKESDDAKIRFKELTKEIDKLKKERNVFDTKIKTLQNSFDKYIEIDDEIKAIQNAKLSDKDLKEEAKKTLLELQRLFGTENTFAEVQYHGIEREAYCMPILASIAHQCNVPLVAANDVHIVTNSKEDRRKRQILRSLRYNKYEEEYVGDDQLYMKTNEELAESLLQILSEEDVQEALDNTVKIASMCEMENVEEHHYPKFHSEIEGEDANKAIRRMARERIEWRFPNKEGWNQEYEDRLEYELKIICDMGYADYHLIVQDFLNIGRKMGHMPEQRLNYLGKNISNMSLQEIVDYIEEDQSEVGLTIGPGRGSAVGSLVCYLLGITSIDPLKYDLIFERFLNPERISMPDIDSDFASEVRNLVIEYVKRKYGNDAVCCIMTKETQATKGSIRNCARILGSEYYNDTKKFLSLGDRLAKTVPNTVGTKFSSVNYYEYKGQRFKTIDDLNNKLKTNYDDSTLPKNVKKVTVYEDLKNTFADDKNALKIIEDAKLVEGTFTNYGMHAAGVIISDNNDVSDYVPLMWDKKTETWKTQCDMVEAEENGLLKMDFLGLNNLSIITKCLRLIYQRTGKKIDIEKVPFEKEVFESIYQMAYTNAVFQFESPGMKQMLKQFKPSNIEDITLLNAAYRPGPMQYLNDIVLVKHKRKKMEYFIPELKPILDNTYGSIIYQEQVMRICQELAGYSLGGADLVRRYMSKKKAVKLEEERNVFVFGSEERNIKGCVGNGIEKEKANELFDQMMDFAKYAFNKSHACAYAFVSYYTAYLKYHYPTEYLCSVMSSVPLTKIPSLIEDCKNFNINVLPPDINKSESDFAIEDNSILFGLKTIKNVNKASSEMIQERRENGIFSCFSDFLLRGHVKKDATESLIKAGAFDCFCSNRTAVLKLVPTAISYLKKISDNTKKLTEKEIEKQKLEQLFKDGKIEEKEYTKKITRMEKSIKGYHEKIDTNTERIKNLVVPSIAKDKEQCLKDEKEMLGVYVSSHPLDDYPSTKELGTTDINELVSGKETATIFGIIKEVRRTTRKSDGMPMAFFQLEDRTGTIDIKCFTKTYQEYGNLIEEDAIVKIKGTVFEEEVFGQEDEMKLSFNANSFEVIEPAKQAMIIHSQNIEEWDEDLAEVVQMFKDDSGHPLLIHFVDGNTIQKLNYSVNYDILSKADFRIALI